MASEAGSVKVALVTAGGSGMGAAAARRLVADGFKIAILSSSGKGEALAGELGGLGVTGSNQSGDDLRRLVDLALERWGRIDALVNSAGHGPRAPEKRFVKNPDGPLWQGQRGRGTDRVAGVRPGRVHYWPEHPDRWWHHPIGLAYPRGPHT